MLNQQWKNINADMRNRDWLLLISIVIGAIIFRLVLMSKAYSIGFDEVNYMKLAASGKIHGLRHVLHTYWSPFYPLVVALLSYLIPNFEVAGRLLSVLCASFIIIPLFFFVKTNFNKKIAFGTSILIAFFSFSAVFSIRTETEFVYSFVAINGIILGWSALKYKHVAKAFIIGVLFGLAYLSRPEGIGFLITFWVIIFIVTITQIFIKRRFNSYIYILLLSGIGFSIVSFPYLLFLRQATGVWTISTKGTANQQGEMYVMNKNQYQENPFHVLSEDNTRLLQDEIYHIGNFVTNLEIKGESVVKISIHELAKKVFENFYIILREALTKVLTLPLVILLGLGLFKDPWTQEKARLNLYLLSYIIFFWFILIPVFHISLRYFIPLLPISFIWIAKGADYLIEWLISTFKNTVEKLPTLIPIKTVSLIIIIIVILFTSILPEFGKRMKKNIYSTEEWAPSIEQKKAGLWLKKIGVKSPVIMAYNHAVSFYAGNYNIKESIEIPENRVEPLLEYAKHRGVNYLVLNDRYKHNHPLIEHLYEQKDVPPDLKLIYFNQEKNSLRTLIYEVIY